MVIWEVGSSRLLADYTLETRWSSTRLITRAPRAFSTASDGGRLAGWQLEQGQYGLSPHSDSVTGVAIAAQAARAVSVSRDDTLRIWQLGPEPGGRSLTPELHWATRGGPGKTCVALTPDGTRAVSGSMSEHLAVWDLDTCDCGILAVTYPSSSSNPRPPIYSVQTVAISADGHRAISVSAQTNEMIVWDVTERVEHNRIKGAVERRVALTPDLRYGISDGSLVGFAGKGMQAAPHDHRPHQR